MRAAWIAAALVALPIPARARVAVTAYVDNNVAGNVQSGRPGLGVSAGYYLGDRIGLELDGEVHGHFFRDQDVADQQPAGVDLNTTAMLGSGNIVVPYCLHGGYGTWCPYGTIGVGVIHATFKGTAHAPGATGFDRAQTNLTLNAGVGVMHALTRWVGLRVDARYLHAFVDENATGGGYFKDYGFWRVSFGFLFGGPPSEPLSTPNTIGQ